MFARFCVLVCACFVVNTNDNQWRRGKAKKKTVNYQGLPILQEEHSQKQYHRARCTAWSAFRQSRFSHQCWPNEWEKRKNYKYLISFNNGNDIIDLDGVADLLLPDDECSYDNGGFEASLYLLWWILPSEEQERRHSSKGQRGCGTENHEEQRNTLLRAWLSEWEQQKRMKMKKNKWGKKRNQEYWLDYLEFVYEHSLIALYQSCEIEKDKAIAFPCWMNEFDCDIFVTIENWLINIYIIVDRYIVANIIII